MLNAEQAVKDDITAYKSTMKLSEIVKKVNTISKQPFDWSELDEIMVELHAKLTEHEWVIKDEKIRDEYERLFINHVVKRFKEQL
jgi:hypothetical protein